MKKGVKPPTTTPTRPTDSARQSQTEHLENGNGKRDKQTIRAYEVAQYITAFKNRRGGRWVGIPKEVDP